jgi:hypothetical protein
MNSTAAMYGDMPRRQNAAAGIDPFYEPVPVVMSDSRRNSFTGAGAGRGFGAGPVVGGAGGIRAVGGAGPSGEERQRRQRDRGRGHRYSSSNESAGGGPGESNAPLITPDLGDGIGYSGMGR